MYDLKVEDFHLPNKAIWESDKLATASVILDLGASLVYEVNNQKRRGRGLNPVNVV